MPRTQINILSMQKKQLNPQVPTAKKKKKQLSAYGLIFETNKQADQSVEDLRIKTAGPEKMKLRDVEGLLCGSGGETGGHFALAEVNGVMSESEE